MKPEINAAVLERLTNRRPLDDLPLSIKDGRVDLSGLALGPLKQAGTTSIPGVMLVSGRVEIKNAQLRHLDFTGSRLSGLLLVDSHVEDCVFDKVKWTDGGVWETKFINCRFVRSNVKGICLGGRVGRKRTSFEGCIFDQADLRQTVYDAAEFNRCSFLNCRLDKVDFEASAFTDCKFVGLLKETSFDRYGIRGDFPFPPNEMSNVDFTEAILSWTDFRSLDLLSVRFPKGDDYLVFRDYRAALDALLRAAQARPELRIEGTLARYRKWAGQRGMLNRRELIEMVGAENTQWLLSSIPAFLIERGD